MSSSLSAPAAGEPMTWQEELATLVGDTGIRLTPATDDNHWFEAEAAPPPIPAADDEYYGFGAGAGAAAAEDRFTAAAAAPVAAAAGRAVGDGYYGFGETPPAAAEESWKDQVKGFLAASGEMLVELGRGCKDIAQQSLGGVEDHYVVKKVRGRCAVVGERLGFLNEYLPEDRDPVHSWTVVVFVSLIALSALSVNTGHQTSELQPKKLYIHPPSASRIELPDGRYLAYEEQGVPADKARFSLIVPHSFLSSRLAGIPGINASLLDEFGVRLVSYDLPGFGESDPHPDRNLNSSALDIQNLADAVGVKEKFWMVGYSGGGIHAWAAIRYIPDRLAGAAMFAPMGNPYESEMTKEERYKTWEKWTARRKFLYILARRFPSLLPRFYRRSFLSGKQGQPEKWLSLSLGKKDKALIEDPIFNEFRERDVAESIRQGNPKPFVEEAVLQVSNWGFSLADLQVQKKHDGNRVLHWLKSLYSQTEHEWAGFLGPIHIWQGMEDRVVPPSMTEFVRRVVPGATVHKLIGEGHFSYFYFCDECHRQVFSTLFGTPQGPLSNTEETIEEYIDDESTSEGYSEDTLLVNNTEQQ